MGQYVTINPTASGEITGSGTANQLAIFSSTSVLTSIANVDTGSVLVSNGTGSAPTWSSSPTLSVSLTTPSIFGSGGVLNIATSAVLTGIVIGNTTAGTYVNINTGTGGTTWTTTNGVWTLNTGTGTINIGTNAAAKAITIGNSTAGNTIALTCAGSMNFNSNNGAITINAGTGTISIGTDAADHTITIGNSTGATPININAGTGGVNIGTNAIAHTIVIGNTTGATAVNFNSGTGNNSWTTTNGSWTIATGTGAVTICGDATVNTLNIGTGAAAKTIKFGSASGTLIGFFGVTAIVQVTTGIAAATFVANTSGIANDTATWDGYTAGQVVKALRNYGLLT